jgi:murein DD-endopeptidase MepM/ murein hydrolase activator NlpD
MGKVMVAAARILPLCVLVLVFPAVASAQLLKLPWPRGEEWFYTGGPHYGGASVRSGVDFAPGAQPIACPRISADIQSTRWVVAAADGVVITSRDSIVEIDHTGGLRTGYMHLADIQVQVGDPVMRGERLGHPSCAAPPGGSTTGVHLHFYFKQGEEHVPADRKVLSGWTIQAAGTDYNGTMTKPNENTRTADGGRCAPNRTDLGGCTVLNIRNDLISDNGDNKLSVTESNLDEWCVRHGADDARLINQTAYGWACYRRGVPSQPAINMLAYCQDRYPQLNYIDFMGNFYDPLSWECVGPVAFLGGHNLPQYCVNHGFSNASPPGRTVGDWSCITSDGRHQPIRTDSSSGVGELSMADACREQYKLPIIRARVADYYNPASVQCWGSRETPLIPTAPSNTSVFMTSGGHGIGVSWRDNSNNEAGFDVFNGVIHLLVRPNQTFISSDWGGLSPRQNMCFQVRAYNAAGSSAPTPRSCLTVP